jgi:hypothetical protein
MILDENEKIITHIQLVPSHGASEIVKIILPFSQVVSKIDDENVLRLDSLLTWEELSNE